MRRISVMLSMLAVLSLAPLSSAGALGTSARSVIPSEVQQIIAVDYRQLNNSPTAVELHDRLLPDNLKQFETALKGIGIQPSRDIDHLTFASFRDKGQFRFVGIAEGDFALKTILARLKAKKIKPVKYHDALLYDMSGGMQMIMLDPSTMLFGDLGALKAAIQARDGDIRSLNSNSSIVDMMPSVESEAVWSVLDSIGTQTMLSSALGEASQLADYNTIKKRLVGSRYAMDFSSGVNFNLDVITSDRMTAATLSSLMKAGMMFKKMQATGPEKLALDSMSVDSDSDQLKIHFKSDDQKFQSLLNSELFAAVAR